MMIFALLIASFAGVAWFTMNKEVGAGGMSITTATMPFDIATLGTEVRNRTQLFAVRPDYGEGEEEEFTSVVAGTYNVAGNTDTLILRFTPEEEDDPLTEDIDESEAPDIGPGSMGDLSFYVVPKINGPLDVYITLDLVAFKAVILEDDEELLIEITDDLTASANITAEQVASCKNALNYLKGHIMFFGGLSESEAYSYVKPITDGKIHFHLDNATAGVAYKVPIYWTWPNTLGQIALKTNTNELRNGTPVVQETTNMGTSAEPTDKAVVLKYLKDNKDIVFKDLDLYDSMTNDQKTEYNALSTDEEKAAYIEENVNVDDWINNADTEEYFDLLSEGYNNADFTIGTNLNYFMIEVQVSQNE